MSVSPRIGPALVDHGGCHGYHALMEDKKKKLGPEVLLWLVILGWVAMIVLRGASGGGYT